MRALVTGGAGFIGHHLVAELVRHGNDVVVIDNYITGLRGRLSAVESDIEVVEGDIRDAAVVNRTMRGAEVVFHLAALPSVQRSFHDPVTTNEINAGGTINVVKAAADAGARRVVFSGSSSVYGAAPGLPRREEQRPDPRSPYAVSKLAGGGYVLSIGAAAGVESVILRYFNVFGPGQDPMSQYAAVVPRFIDAALSGQRPIIYGDGKQTRDFTYVDNVVAANMLAAKVQAAAGEVFNVGRGERTTLLDLLAVIGRAIGVEPHPSFQPPLPGDVRDSEADISHAREILGYEPDIDLVGGIERTATAFQRTSRAT
jgi:UDP-glucose 4-epimerase